MAMIISKTWVSFGETNQPWMNNMINVPNFLRKLEHILWKPNIFFANIGTKILPWKWRILLIMIAALLFLCWIQLRFIIPRLGFSVGTNQTLMNMITMLDFLRKLEHILWNPNVFFANTGT